MINRIRNKDRSRWYLKFTALSPQGSVWISLSAVLVISSIDLIGKLFKIHLLKSLEPWWIHMANTTYICLGLTLLSFFVLLTGKPARLKKLIPYAAGSLIILISSLTAGADLKFFITGNEAIVVNLFPLNLIHDAGTHFPLVLSFIFFLTGAILILLTADSPLTSNIAHILLFPAAIASYFIPVTYFLGVYTLSEFKNITLGLSTGISLCLVCTAIIFIRPNTWLMEVYTSTKPGGILARKLFPVLIILPLLLGWLRITGENSGLYKSAVGVVFVAISYTVIFILFIWRSARSVNKTSENLKSEIEERKKTEILLKENKAHLERSQEIAHLGSWELDIAKNRLNWTDEVYRIFGLVPGEFDATYEAFLDAVHPDDRSAVDNAYSGSLRENNDMYEIEHRIVRRKTGEVRFVHEKCEHFRDDSGNIIRSVGMVHDITARKKAESQLAESKEKLNIALENGKIGVWEWNLKTEEMALDERMEKILGLEPGMFGGTYKDFEMLLNEEDLSHLKKAINSGLNESAPFETIFRVKLKNEEDKYINAKAMIQRDSSGNPAKMSGVCIDITEMKRGAEQAMFALNEELLRSNNELEQFAYIASHDLQEPLRMISSFSQLLSGKYKGKLDQKAQEYILFIVGGAIRMQNQINDLLALSRIHTKGKEFSLVDMHHALDQAIKYLKPRIHETKAIISNNLGASVMADEGQLVQLFQNLLGNALKYCREIPVINVSCKEEGKNYLVSVKDNGIGIDPQYIERIFKIFQRLHSNEEYEGTGIGLAICKRIVERHNGNIWVESEPGKGAAFYFTIPKIKDGENFNLRFN